MAERLVIVQDKRAYAALLEDACRDLGITDEAQSDRFRALARRCTIYPDTLLSNLRSKGPPEPETLKKLRKGTGIPVTTWLLRLGVLDPEDIGKALEYDAPPELLTEQQQQALDLVEGLDPAEAFTYLEWWAQMPGLEQHHSSSAHRLVRYRGRREQSR